MPKLIICLTGMPGAGKSTIAKGLESNGFAVVNMGDQVRTRAKELGLELNRENLSNLMREMREKDGPDAIAQLVKPAILSATSEAVIVDGVRSSDEIDFFRKIGTVRVLSVHASTDTRFDFLQHRGRSDDPSNRENFDTRDTKEISVGITAPIALADESISNNHQTIDQLVKEALCIINTWEK